jgi:hypothetical protein
LFSFSALLQQIDMQLCVRVVPKHLVFCFSLGAQFGMVKYLDDLDVMILTTLEASLWLASSS